jgi:hypothetical protein
MDEMDGWDVKHGVFRWVKSWKLAVLPCTGMQADVVVFCWDLMELTRVFVNMVGFFQF